jgi:hypothetical protein
MVAIPNHQFAMLTSAGDDKYVNVRVVSISSGFGLEEIPFTVELRSKFPVLESLGIWSLLPELLPYPCKLQRSG